MPKRVANIGHLHSVACEWCGLKMACHCLHSNDAGRDGHIMVLCPTCQVTDFMNVLFGGRHARTEMLPEMGGLPSP
jgi:hypothetical protein